MEENKTKPDIRFKGFADDWEQRKLNEITDVRDGTHASPNYVQEGHPFITSKNVSNGFINYDDVQYVTDRDYAEINKRSKVDVHDILMGMIGTIGNLALIRKEPDFAIKNVALIKYTGKVDYQYLYQALQTNCVKNQLSNGMDGGTQKFVSLKKIRELDIPFQEEQEQTKIGQYFSQLDNLITLHQRKCDQLKKLKKTMLKKMFPCDGSSIPEIRFTGFTDDWEQRKLSSLLTISSKKNNGYYKIRDILAASLGTELQKKYVYFGLKATDDSIKNYKVVLKNDVIYTKSPIKGFPNGIIRTNKGENGIVPTLYCVYHCKENVNASIIQSYFDDKNRLDKYLFPLVNVGARNNVNITDKEFLKGTIIIPVNFKEQNQIIKILEKLDNLITLHQRELEILKNLKKTCLKRMFI